MIKTYPYLLAISLLLAGTTAIAGEIVNINTADRKALAYVIMGVGEKKADAIIAYREKHGDFESIDELSQVRGIDKGIIEKNRERLTLE